MSSGLIGCRPKPRRELVFQPQFWIRPSSSDEKAIREVFDRNAYRRRGFGIAPGDRWLDLGANVGAFTVLASALGAQVRAYEAEPENAKLAARNAALNHRHAQAARAPMSNRPGPVIHHAAVVPDSHRGETVGLHVNTAPLALRRHSITRARKQSSVVEVPAVRFSSLLVDGFDCLKINIEGAEVAVLQERLDWSPVRRMVFEWSFDAEPRMAVLRAVLDRLEAAFPHVELSKKNLPWDRESYPFFPPNVYVFCWRD